ncbi:hypothetical protein [Shimazuella kribbensis]|uniref:hypothetical protein n=1 Tax=Shimazuella kribbensis TaxID=139808 RepID=UPI00040EE0D1|nr:hypothetical protein [Shimazuella kribbensis]
MERKIDKALSRILPNGLPDYPGLPKRWFLYPYGLLIFLFAVPGAIYYIISKAMAEFAQNPMGVSIISSAYLAVLLISFFFIIRLNIRYWLVSVPIPHTFEEFVSFAEYIETNGNRWQKIFIYEYIISKFNNQNVSAIEVKLGVAYLQEQPVRPEDQEVITSDQKKGIEYLEKALQTNDKTIKNSALKTLRDFYTAQHDHQGNDQLRKMELAYGE